MLAACDPEIALKPVVPAAAAAESPADCLRNFRGLCSMLTLLPPFWGLRARDQPIDAGYGFLASTARQRVISDCRNLPSSSGVLCFATRPMSVKRLRRSGFASAAPISAFSFCTIARGVPAGANTPPQLEKSQPGTPPSVAVGLSGNHGLRLCVATP